MSAPRKLIRQSGVISADTYYGKGGLNGKAAVEALVAEVDAKAREIAALHGIKRLHVTTNWGLYVVCGFTDYPMYLCGPGAPQIRTAADVFKHVWHLENPHAEYTVVIRCQDEVDADDIRFYEERADQLAAKGEAAFLKQWTSNVLAGAQKVLDRRRQLGQAGST